MKGPEEKRGQATNFLFRCPQQRDLGGTSSPVPGFPVLDLFVSLGGEPLEGSGFEEEIPEPESEWRDPR